MHKNREEAFALLCEYTKNPNLVKHCLSVEAAMRWYGKHFNCTEDEIEKWAICGLLHDFDYEQHPDPTPPDGHPFFGNRVLEELGYGEDIREAIMGHALYSGVARKSLMAKTLFAVDELCGLVTAATLVRPDKSLLTLGADSVKRKMKDKHFAAGCNRDDIKLGAEELGVELTQHITNVIEGMKVIAPELGLAG